MVTVKDNTFILLLVVDVNLYVFAVKKKIKDKIIT